MKKVIMCSKSDLSEVEVNIDEIKLQNGKFYVKGEELSMVIGTIDFLEIFYTGVKKALNGEITEQIADEFLKKLSHK